jgi:hypothetical protein
MDVSSAPGSSRSIRVELPSHSYVFTIVVPENNTIAAVKEAIKLQCAGEPREEGQRLIHRGRILRDNETVKDIWKDQVRNRLTALPDRLSLTHMAHL